MSNQDEYFPEEPAPRESPTPSGPSETQKPSGQLLPEPVSEFRVTSKEYRCPACGRLVYSRRLKKCGFCELPLPPEFLLTEAEAIDKEKEGGEMKFYAA